MVSPLCHQRGLVLRPDPQGRERKSPALVADGKHLFTDVVSSVGVLAGVALAALTGYRILDPILAALVALNVLWSGWRLMKESVGGLLDEAVPDEELDTHPRGHRRQCRRRDRGA